MLGSGHWVEAAFTTLLHAELLSWDDVDDTLAAADGFPEQSSFERKVALYHDAIDMFAKGKDWENAVRYVRLPFLFKRQKKGCCVTSHGRR